MWVHGSFKRRVYGTFDLSLYNIRCGSFVTLLPALVDTLRFPPAIQKHENRGALATKNVGNLFVMDHGLT